MEWFTISSISNLIAKIAYTGFLILAIVLLLRLAWNVWGAGNIVVGEISYVSGGKIDQNRAKALTEEIVDHRNVVRELVYELIQTVKQQQDEQQSLHAIYQSLLTVEELRDIESAAKSIPEIKLSIQGNDIGTLLSTLQQWISPRYVMKISVFERENISYSINWPRPHPMIGTGYVSRGHRSNFVSSEDLGASLGCRILWLELAESSERIANVSPEVFCRWVRARQLLEVSNDMEAIGSSKSKVEELLATALSLVEPLNAKVSSYPPLQKIYVSLLSKMPGTDQKRIRYADWNLALVLDGKPPMSYEEFAKLEVNIEAATVNVSEQFTCNAGDLVVIQGGKWGVAKVTVNSVIVDSQSTRFLLLPDYAFTDGATEVYELDGNNKQGTGRHIGTLERIYAKAQIATVRIDSACDAGNNINQLQLSGLELPLRGQRLSVVSRSTPERFARVVDTVLNEKNIESALIVSADIGFSLDKRLFSPGDGGAPLINEQNELVGMAYSSGSSASFGLALMPFMEQHGFSLLD